MKVYFNENGEFLKATGSSIFAESENSDVLELKLPMALANSVVYTTFLLPFPEDSEQYGNYKAESLLMTLTVDEQDGGIMWRGVLSAGYLVNAGIAYLSARVATQNGTIVKTTEQVKFEIGAGGAYQATPILPEQAEQLAEAIAQLQADVLDLQTDKQDKIDYTINLEQFPLENTVVGAINSIGEQVKTNTDDIETNTQDIATNRNDIDEIKQTMSTGENPIGTMTGSALPTDAQLNAFVEDNTDPSREPLVGDVIIFVLELAQETDKNYKYYYRGTTKGWAYYEIPPIEKASNVAYGILRGTYTVGTTADTLVDISGGEIIAIWVKDTTVVPTQYRRVNDYANSLQTQIRAIINGSQVVGKSTRAVQDESGNNIVDTYLTKVNGASKLFVKDYALPRIFNDVYYLALGGYQKTVPTTPASGVQFETTTSAVGNFELFTAEQQNSSDFEISAKNSSSNNIYVSANRDVGVRFRLTTQVSIQGGAWQTASVELTNKYTLESGEIVKVPFSSFFNALGDTVLDLTTGDKFRQKLEVVTEESESTTFSVYSSETYPSSLNLNISSMSIIVAQGELGEQPTNVANGTKENSTITFELLESSKLNNNTECLFTFNFDGEIEGTDEVIAQYNGDDIRIVTPYNVEVGNPTIDEFNELMSKYDEQAGYSWEFKGFVKNDIDGIKIIVDMPNLLDIKEDVDDLYTEIESIDNRVTTNEGNITTLQGNITTLQGDVGNLQTGLSGAVADIGDLQTGKQDNLSTAQLSAVNSGVTSATVTQVGTNAGNITTLQSDVTTINSKIPTQASAQDQLAPKSFVNSTVQTASANFRGNWANWASVPMTADEYPADYAGVRTPSTNDYMVVQDASGYSAQTTGTWRFKYSGLWSTDGRNGWQPEYQVNETPLTAQQLAALNSGITSSAVEQIDHNEQTIADLEDTKQDLIDSDNKLSADLVDDTSTTNKFVTSAEKSTWNGKQNALTPTQLSAVNSGANTTNIGQIATNASAISALQSGKQDNLSTTQLSAVNSGITSTLVGKITTNETNITTLQTSKQNAITSNNKLSADLIEDGTTNKVFTATEQTKLNGIANGAQVNVIESVKSGVTTFPASDKAVDIQGVDNLTNYYTKSDTYTKTEIDGKIASVYKPAGSVAFANLPSLASNVLGNVYNVTDSFTTTSDFVEGAGVTYPAGTNVVVVNIGTAETPVYKFDVLSGFVDLSGYVPTSRKVNNKALTSDISLSASDVGAEPTITKNSAFNKNFETSTSNIKMNGSVSVGSLDTVARADHIHPSDTSKMNNTNPTGTGSFSLNRKENTTIGTNSFAEGDNTTASGNYSHAEGYNTTSSSNCAHAEGRSTTASSNCAHAEGYITTASGNYSHAEGRYTTAQGQSQHVFGEFNIADTEGTTSNRGKYVEIVGKGTSDIARSNARTLDWSGNEEIAGNLKAAGLTDGTTTKTMSNILSLENTPLATTAIAGKVKPDGTSITVDADGTIHSQSSGTAWGTITGTLSNQTDLQSALNAKQNNITSSNKLSADLTQDGTTNKVFTATEKTKLNGIANGAQVNTVSSVNNKTGAVSLSASDVGALPSTTTYVSSVNGSSGAVTGIAKTDLSNVTYPSLTADGVERTGSGDRVIKSKISSDGKSWYRVWASGWKECGMVGQYKSSWALLGFTLPITFSNTNYTITITRTINNYSGYAGLMCNGYSNKTTSGFSTYADSGYPIEVYACGY